MKPRHLIKVEDLTKKEYLDIFRQAKQFLKKGGYGDLAQGKVLATLFFQESLRTLNTFKAAMIRLGGGVIGLEGIQGTYIAKGEEDKEDTITQFGILADIMVIRDSDAETLDIATKVSEVPIINGGAGTEEHASGGIVSGMDTYLKFGKIDGLKVGVYGAPGPSRAAKAIIKFFSMFKTTIYEDVVIPELGLTRDVYDFVEEQGNQIFKAKLENFIGDVDYLIVEGIPTKYVIPKIVKKYLDAYKPITLKEVRQMKKNAILAVISPRLITEGLLSATKDVDTDPRAASRYTSRNWTFANMALIVKLLGL